MNPFSANEDWGLPTGYNMDYANSQDLIRSMEELLATGTESGLSSGQAYRSQKQQSPSIISNNPEPQPNLTQPVGCTNDGSTIYVNAQNAAQLGLSGWAGHRVIALPGEMVNPITLFLNLDSGEASAVPTNPMSGQMSGHGLSNSMYQMPNPLPQSADSLMHQPNLNVNSWHQLLAAGNPVSTSVLDQHRGHLPDLQSFGRGRGGGGGGGGRGNTYAQRGRQAARMMPPNMQMQIQQQARMSAAGQAAIRAAPPTWAGADWDPLRNVKSWEGPRQGTGVFLPPGTGVFLPPSMPQSAVKAPVSAPTSEIAGMLPSQVALSSDIPFTDARGPSTPGANTPTAVSHDGAVSFSSPTNIAE